MSVEKWIGRGIMELFGCGVAFAREIRGSEEAISDARGHGFLWFFHGALVVRCGR
ncbi:hypothetical protein [Tunturiibacter gelidoferens]|uniref:hypothetical protein n=1 Tax=Tunturiibacter gelidiferens TaxID=3069689 RepID=UPI001C54BDCC|nr:hypothetical protein [Edaphobacter lichenicola]